MTLANRPRRARPRCTSLSATAASRWTGSRTAASTCQRRIQGGLKKNNVISYYSIRYYVTLYYIILDIWGLKGHGEWRGAAGSGGVPLLSPRLPSSLFLSPPLPSSPSDSLSAPLWSCSVPGIVVSRLRLSTEDASRGCGASRISRYGFRISTNRFDFIRELWFKNSCVFVSSNWGPLANSSF